MEDKRIKKKFKTKSIPVVPEINNERIAIEKLLKENISFCVSKDFITIEGRNNTFVYCPEFDTWAMKTSQKVGEGIDTLISLLLRR